MDGTRPRTESLGCGRGVRHRGGDRGGVAPLQQPLAAKPVPKLRVVAGALPVHVGEWALANRGGLSVLPAPSGHPVCRAATVGDAVPLRLVGAAAPPADPLGRWRRRVGLPPCGHPARGGAVAIRDGARGNVEPTALVVGAQTGAAGGLGSGTPPRSTLGAPASPAHDAPPSPAVRNAWPKRYNLTSIYII